MDSPKSDEADLFDLDESGQALRRWLYRDGQHLDANRASKLRKLLRELGVRELSITFVCRGLGLVDIRFELAARIGREDN